MKSFSRIISYLWPEVKKHKTSFFLVFIFYGLGVLLNTIIKPYLYKEIIDIFVSSGVSVDSLHKVTNLGFELCVLIVFYVICFRAGDFSLSYHESKVMKRLNDTTFKRLLGYSYTFFSNNFSGSIVAKARRFGRSYEIFFDMISYQIWFSLVGLAGVLVVLFKQVPLMALVFLVWVVIYIFITMLFIKKKMVLDQEEASADSSVTGQFSDAITNVLNVKIFGRSLFEQKSFNDTTKNEEQKRRRAWNFGNMQNFFQSALMAVLQISVLFLSIYLWSQKMITVGTVVLIQTYIVGLSDILWGLGRSLTRALKALTDMKEIVDIFEQVPDILDSKKPEISRMKNGEIIFENVNFGYGDEILVFSDFNLKIESGEKIGFVGHSGAGKSTITKLLLRFVDVSSGKILIDGQDIRNVTQDDLRSFISYVPQESILFHRTIRENISYGKENATLEDIEESAKKARAHGFISKLTSGYDTIVGERGVKLSGGERQRVAIARAMLKNSPILILDEATSSLDSVSEAYIQDSFNELMKGKTTLVIAHRLSTIQKMDRIVVLEDGKIIEIGNHKQLIEKNGIYADLWNHQSGGFIE